MKILYIDDNPIKSAVVMRQLKIFSKEIEKASTLNDAKEKIEETSYDLVITDMWYPVDRGGKDHNSGEDLINWMKDRGDETPIILISSIEYSFPVYGCLHYDDDENWDEQLKRLIRELLPN